MIFICVNAHKDRVAQKLVDIGYSFGALKIIQRQSVGFQFFIFVSNEWKYMRNFKRNWAPNNCTKYFQEYFHVENVST